MSDLDDSLGSPLPRNMIRQIACAAGRSRATRAGKADGAEPIDQDARFPCLIIYSDVAFEEVIAELAGPLHDTRLEGPGEPRKRMRRKPTGSFIRA